MLLDARKVYYNNIIEENCENPTKLFGTLGNLLHRKSEQKLPSHTSVDELTNRFVDYFSEKITNIRSDLDAIRQQHQGYIHRDSNICVNLMTDFAPVTEEQVSKIIKDSASKCCTLDPIPTWLIKDCLDVLLSVITKIVNLSLSNSTMLPGLKKALMDSEILKNFRQISNLSYISKIIEKVVSVQSCAHVNDNDLHEPLQSAYKQYHSTETVLLHVQIDILMAIDNRYAVILVLLDLSAAFDTVDHKLLLDRLGITGNALLWFKSYLTDRKQRVQINGVCSKSTNLTCGVPQGSVLGPILEEHHK